MTAPYLVTCLATLRTEFNELSPGRDKGSDGWIGDAAHQKEKSDHNPAPDGRVLALDVDSSGPWPVPFGDLVESLRGDSRLEYVIWNRRIASRDQGWKWRPYVDSHGNPMPDPHTNHAHFSARHDHTSNTSTATWHLEDFMELTDEQIDAIADRCATKVWGYMFERPDSTTTPKAKTSAGGYQRYGDVVAAKTTTDVVAALEPKLDEVIAALAPPTPDA